MASILLLLFGGILLVGGVSSIKHGFDLRKQRQLIEDTPTEEVESLSMGQSEIEGRARPTDEGTITAPFTDEECLVAVWEVEEFDVSTDSDGHTDRQWHTRGNGVDFVPFLVDDGTGQVLVEPSEENLYEIDEDEEDPVLIRHGEQPSGRVADFLGRDDWEGITLQSEVWSMGGSAENTSGYTDGDRRFKQHLIQPDESVYVFGYVDVRDDVRSADNAANAVIRKVPEADEDLEDMFLISDKEEEEIVEDREGAMWWLPMGALLATIGFGMFLWGILG